MNSLHRQALGAIAGELVAEGKGILAADESSGTMTKRTPSPLHGPGPSRAL
ncbi:MAG: class I fructose-bisphosphate aldolase [Solirubrobacteraceae bacterium]